MTQVQADEIARICTVPADPVAYSALLSIMGEPKMVSQICIEKKIPLSSTYKAVKKLQKAGLAYAHGYVNIEPSRAALYKSTIESISIRVEKQGGKVEITTDGKGSFIR